MKRAGIALLLAISACAGVREPAAVSSSRPAAPAVVPEPLAITVFDRGDVRFVRQSGKTETRRELFSLADLPLDDPPPLSTFRIPLPTSSLRAERAEAMISSNDLTMFYTYAGSGGIQPMVGSLVVPCRGHGQAATVATEKRLFWQTDGLTFAGDGGLVWENAKGFYNPVDCEVQKSSHTWTTLHELVPQLVWGAKRTVDGGQEVTLVVLGAKSVVTSHDLGANAHATLRLGATLGPQAFARVTLPPGLSSARTSIAAALHDAATAHTLVSIELRGSEGTVFTATER